MSEQPPFDMLANDFWTTDRLQDAIPKERKSGFVSSTLSVIIQRRRHNSNDFGYLRPSSQPYLMRDFVDEFPNRDALLGIHDIGPNSVEVIITALQNAGFDY
ncbi:hypothetical protein JXR01_01965 [Candidatus Kaiserbacteria bacterium]|nr:MAG: hypothetical protein JXR01_01965 [Candidatus Kaiserbacteria bacterium]